GGRAVCAYRLGGSGLRSRVGNTASPEASAAALSVQETPERLARVALRLLRYPGLGCPIEPVICPRIKVKLDRHPGAAQPIRVDHVFLEEEIEAADRDVGRGQA